jgi:hypothetical protein
MVEIDNNQHSVVDFPLDPTPSLEAYREFHRYIKKYLQMFEYYDGTLSIGPINLGTSNNAFVKAPIEMDTKEIGNHLRPAFDILKSAIAAAKKSIDWTQKIIKITFTTSSEADERIKSLEKIVDEIQFLLHEHKNIAWHPRCYEKVRNLVETSFKQGEPGIAVKITIIV